MVDGVGWHHFFPLTDGASLFQNFHLQEILAACCFPDRKSNKQPVPPPHQIHNVISSQAGSHLLLSLGGSLQISFFPLLHQTILFCTFCWEKCRDSLCFFPKEMVGNRCTWKCGSDGSDFDFVFVFFPPIGKNYEAGSKQAEPAGNQR